MGLTKQGPMILLPLLLLLASHASSTCYYRDGTIAEDDEPCPNSNICCPSGATCLDNLLCRDKNNFANGSTVTFPDIDETYNYTDLYHTSSCQSQSYDGCSIQCTTYNSNAGEYIWACNSALTSYCCHSDPESLAQYDCCQNGTFSLASPGQGTSTSTSTTTTTSTSTSTALTTPATSSTSTSTATNTIEPEPEPESEQESSNSNSTSLSTGAKAGIGVGAAAAVIIIIALLIVLVRMRARARKRAGMAMGGVVLGEKIPSQAQVAEMPSGGPYTIQEMDGNARPAQLGGGGGRGVYEIG